MIPPPYNPNIEYNQYQPAPFLGGPNYMTNQMPPVFMPPNGGPG